MKNKNILKILVFIVVVILVALISFVGIYKYEKGEMVNIMPEYELSKELNGSRLITFAVDTSTKTSEEEKSTNENSEENTEEVNNEENKEETTEVAVNAPEVLTKENYELSKEIVEKKVNAYGITDYDLRVNKEDGTITLETEESNLLDDVMQFLIEKGDFNIIDTETKEVLLSKDALQDSKVMYYPQTTGTTVFVDLQFKKDAIQKLEEISKTYIQTTGEDGTTTKKTITIKIDDEDFLTTYFDEEEPITNGEIQLSIGQATTDAEKISEYAKTGTYLTTLLNSKNMPIVYTVDKNQFVSPTIDSDCIQILITIFIVLLILAMLYLLIKYKKNGALAVIALFGFVALLMLFIRLTNVQVSPGSMAAILLSTIIEVVFLIELLKDTSNKKMNEAIIKMLLLEIPLFIIALVSSLVTFVPVVSFGTALFWGLIIALACNYLFKFILKSED